MLTDTLEPSGFAGANGKDEFATGRYSPQDPHRHSSFGFKLLFCNPLRVPLSFDKIAHDILRT